MSVYNRIKKGEIFESYLIPSEDFEEVNSALSYIAIIVKPLTGAKGEGVLYIEKRQDGFLLIDLGTEHLLSENQLENWLDDILLEDDTYLVQPFIQSKTKQGQAFNIRLHVQKDGKGKWKLTTMYLALLVKEL